MVYWCTLYHDLFFCLVHECNLQFDCKKKEMWHDCPWDSHSPNDSRISVVFLFLASGVSNEGKFRKALYT